MDCIEQQYNIYQKMDTIKSQTVLLGMFASTLSYGLYKLIGLYRSCKRQEEFVRTSKLYSLNQLINERRSSKPDPKKRYLVKVVKAHEDEKYVFKRPAYLNEGLFCYPDKDQLALNLAWKINNDGEEWRVRDHNTGKHATVKGLGFVVSHIFEFDTKLQPKQITGLFNKINAFVSCFFELVFTIILLPITGFAKSVVFFNGPVVGEFEIKANIAQQMSLVLECTVGENDVIRPIYTASSKSDLLSYLQLQKGFLKILIVSFGVATALALFKILKKKMLQQKAHTGQQFLRFPDADEERACIICMSNCRNIVFEDCLHLAVCDECFPSLDKKECPVCKVPITSVKNVYMIVK